LLPGFEIFDNEILEYVCHSYTLKLHLLPAGGSIARVTCRKPFRVELAGKYPQLP